MDDVDQDWSEPDASGSAIYSSLPIGTHRFHVRACNGDGVWDREGIVYEVTEKAHYYETSLFRVIIALALASIMAFAFKFRLHQVKLDLAQRLEERMNERARIARDLHDTLLQSFHALLLHLQTASNMLPRTSRAGKAIARSFNREGRQGDHPKEWMRCEIFARP